jgi:hypothetical protein
MALGKQGDRWRNRQEHVGTARNGGKKSTARHREDPAVAARRAGDRGRHAEPMPTARRSEIYTRQTGRTRQDLTPKQRRRANAKLFGELRRIYLADPAVTP